MGLDISCWRADPVGHLSSIYDNHTGMDTYREANHKSFQTILLKANAILILNYLCFVKFAQYQTEYICLCFETFRVQRI